MKALLIAAMIALIAVPAYAQRSGGDRRKELMEQESAARKKALDEADKGYKDTLDRIPDAPRNNDPWSAYRTPSADDPKKPK